MQPKPIPTDWRLEAACRHTDPESFFPEGGAAPVVVRICHRCPVKAHCLTEALNNPSLVGIWGGTTVATRRRIRRERARRAKGLPIPAYRHGTKGGYALHYQYNDLPVCDPCKLASMAYDRARRAARSR